ncbi:methionine--tRNA ligase [Candidatus Peregrinibacteria bacterium]|nr:methionine--tRNA ligase [Candidatus Peregrinibacteria bacterium]
MPSKKFYITTAIAYVNAPPHMGHALEFVQTDTIARYKRMTGQDVYFLTGTDEHGVKIYSTAKKAGKEPQQLVDENAAIYKSLKDIMDLSYDDFIQTTDKKRHWPACQKLWKALEKSGDIYEKEYEGLYCEGCEAFMAVRDLVDGNCPVHLKPPAIVKEKNYFFRLSKYSEKIRELIETDQLRIIPSERKNEFLNVLKEGLYDVSFSRPREVLPWGVDVPGDPGQVMYVWCDALTNYISAIGYGENSALFKKYWPADMHVIGKDIVRFHAGIWIGMLLSAGVPLPRSILVHGFITHNGAKMSKTLGNGVDPVEIARKYGKDALRYYLLREIPVGRDGDYSDTLFVERYNSDLANNLGNLLNRVHTLVTRNGITDFDFKKGGEVFKTKVDDTWRKYGADMEEYNLHEAIFHVWRLIDFANRIIDETKPWSLLKTDPQEGRGVLCHLLEVLRHVSILISPFIPTASIKMRQQLGLPPEIDTKNEQGWGALAGKWKKLGEASIIFPRVET